jgi:excisionase family DNA binding protein
MIISMKSVLTTKEVALMLDLSEDRVRHLTSARDIPHYRQGNKVYFKKSEIEEWQLERRVQTNAEINAKAATYATINR